MIRKIDDFLESYATLIQNTLSIMNALTDSNLSQSIIEGHRTLGQIAWHIVATVPEMMKKTGLELSTIDEESLPPAGAAEIITGYQTVSDELARTLKKNWTDADLETTDHMYGQTWKRGLTLEILLNHEIHHRGQMTVLIRQAGAKVPGIMGPSKEDWTKYGMELPAY